MLLKELKNIDWYFYNYNHGNKNVLNHSKLFKNDSCAKLFAYFLRCLNISCYIDNIDSDIFVDYFIPDKKRYNVKISEIYAMYLAIKDIEVKL